MNAPAAADAAAEMKIKKYKTLFYMEVELKEKDDKRDKIFNDLDNDFEKLEKNRKTKNDCNCSDCHNKSKKCGCTDGCDCKGDCKCGDKKKGYDQEDCHCQSCESEDPFDGDGTHYLQDLLRVQAEFDNYRKRMQTVISDARTDGFVDAIERFLPALDSFKMANNMITDKNTLIGIQFIEKGILDTLSKMGIEQINAAGKFNPDLHQAVDTDASGDVESGYIIKEMYKGFTYKGKVIRYAQVIVKK